MSAKGFRNCQKRKLQHEDQSVGADDDMWRKIPSLPTEDLFYGQSAHAECTILDEDIWVGAILTPNGTPVDTKGQKLSYTNFENGFIKNPDLKTCVVLSSQSDYHWRNIKLTSSKEVFALCTDIAAQFTMSLPSPVSTLSAGSTGPDARLTTDADRVTDPEKGVSGTDVTGTNPHTTLVNSAIPDLSVTSTGVVTPTAAGISPEAVTGHTQWGSAPTTAGTTLPFAGVSSNKPLHTNTPVVLTCQTSANDGAVNCCCACALSPNQNNTRKLTNMLDELRQILTVDKASLSSTYRRKHCVNDNRTTSVYMGCVAIVVLVAILIIVIVLDTSHFLFQECRYSAFFQETGNTDSRSI
ncbi:uncharacterized protein LOC117336648 [Pecten maximus]|uniref:uncharacterized protein LOC117336648 n=1 Tax=Pecten maximus TaxID=6579 RepID=UPI001458BF78|nr:uncharacterized protein LOC117336648 [Pecten maximus]